MGLKAAEWDLEVTQSFELEERFRLVDDIISNTAVDASTCEFQAYLIPNDASPAIALIVNPENLNNGELKVWAHGDTTATFPVGTHTWQLLWKDSPLDTPDILAEGEFVVKAGATLWQ